MKKIQDSMVYQQIKNNPIYGHPSASAAGEASTILRELKNRLKDPSVGIGWSAGIYTSNLSVHSSTVRSQREEIGCLLKEIMQEKNTKPIYIAFYEFRDVVNEETKEIEKKKVLAEELVVE